MSSLIISVSGLRGVVGETLTPEIAIRYSAAFAAGLPPGRIVLTRDGRSTGSLMGDAVRSALCASGRTVLDAGIAATPTTGVLVRRLEAAGGVQISASHNPAEYNGIKLFGRDGCVISDSAGKAVLDRFQDGTTDWRRHDAVGTAKTVADTTGEHSRLILATVDVKCVRVRRLRVLLDANRGAGSLLGERLLAELGCDVTILGGERDGQFEHPPEPTEENLTDVGRAVVTTGADVGFCQDPDADRLALIDETGRYIGEEYTVPICLRHVLQSRTGPVVTNCSTSRMSADVAAQFGASFHLSKVGEANVTAVMREHDAVFGGEGNGGPIDPRVGYVRDSFVGMALVLDAMATTGKRLGELADELPRYEIHKTRMSLAPDRLVAAFASLKGHFADAEFDEMDGLRFDWPDKWLLIRASNTEPIVRVIAECKTADEALRLCSEAGQVIDSTKN